MAHGNERGDHPDEREVETDLVLALTTEANLDLAEKLAQALLEKGLVACVALMPIVSLYRWEGEHRRDDEVQLLLKTHATCLQALHDTVQTLHSYSTPEWITLAGHSRGGYGQWCAEQLGLDARPSDQMLGHEFCQ